MGTNRLTRAASEAAQISARVTLGDILPPGSKLFMLVTRVSRSGMSRRIRCFVPYRADADAGIRRDGIRDVSYLCARALGWGVSDDGVLVHGCGMDMGFHLASELAHAVHGSRCAQCGEPWPCTVVSNRKSYAADVVAGHTLARPTLTHEWL